jgi:DNA polymerase-3 subunit delta
VLLLTGPEDMLKRQHLDDLRQALEKAHGELHLASFDGKTATLAEVLDELRTFSMMQQYKLVIVDDADQFVKETTRPGLERYAQAPVDNATLVLRSEKWNAGKLDKLIEKVGAKIKCEHLSAAEARHWLIHRSEKTHQRKIEPRAAELLVQRMGASLHKLDSELGKLALMVEPSEPISAALIEQVVGRAGDEQAYVVQEAILQALTSGRRGSMTPGGAAIVSIHELIDISGQPKELVGYFVADLMRKLCLASMLKRQGASDFEVGKELRLWGGRERLLLNLLRKLGSSAWAKPSATSRGSAYRWRTNWIETSQRRSPIALQRGGCLGFAMRIGVTDPRLMI